ncbi:hypothetical protein AURDEDRAFT_171323 [Auricularia subglabra TFB-10046 SS5]|uniref:Uncharacterized protein n=1 Tax=Auricularia subglabra (strain TFB-10046 / SS5) TaxID=717982 RepID=J0DBZ1_AURST|nr:hypothetical protein AURDEDRAFT_171323 [Auricularia subglabra TFB-10046 SS5]
MPLHRTEDQGICIGERCAAGARVHKVVLVFINRFAVERVKLCDHTSLPVLLMKRGLFCSGPTLPGYAFSLDLLNLFRGLLRHGGNSVQSLAASLHDQHRQYGYVLRGAAGQPIQEGYRRTLAAAENLTLPHWFMWYSTWNSGNSSWNSPTVGSLTAAAAGSPVHSADMPPPPLYEPGDTRAWRSPAASRTVGAAGGTRRGEGSSRAAAAFWLRRSPAETARDHRENGLDAQCGQAAARGAKRRGRSRLRAPR